MEASRHDTRFGGKLEQAAAEHHAPTARRKGNEEKVKEPNEPRGVASKGDGAGAELKCKRQSQ